jgi:hypothetical protein
MNLYSLYNFIVNLKSLAALWAYMVVLGTKFNLSLYFEYLVLVPKSTPRRIDSVVTTRLTPPVDAHSNELDEVSS